MERQEKKRLLAVPRYCLNCNVDVSHRDKRAKFCTPKCRLKFHKKIKRNGQVIDNQYYSSEEKTGNFKKKTANNGKNSSSKI